MIYSSIFSHGTAGCWKGTPEPCQHLHAAPPQRRPVFHVHAQTRGKHTITISLYYRKSFEKEKKDKCCAAAPEIHFIRVPILLKPIAYSCNSVQDANCGVKSCWTCAVHALLTEIESFLTITARKERGKGDKCNAAAPKI